MHDPTHTLTFDVDRARLEFVLRGQPVSFISAILLATTTVTVMWEGVSHARLIGWLAVFFLVTLGRAALFTLTHTEHFIKRPIAFWRQWFVVGCGLSGICWGVATQLFYTSDAVLSLFMAVIIAGTAAGSITSLASDRWAAYAFVLPCVVPFTIVKLLSGNTVDVAIGVVTFLFLATIGGSINRFHMQLALMMQARAELQESQASVHALNNRMKLAASAAKAGIYEWNLVTKESNWDAQVFELWDLDPADGPATVESWRSRIHPADLASTQAHFAEIFRCHDDFDLEFRVVSRAGLVRDIRSRGQVQRNERGEPVKMIGLVMDVSELRKLDRMKQEFVSVVSHELRTPLTSIRGALGLLSNAGGTLSLAKNQQLLDLANRNAERLTLLIDDILDMEKIESGKMQFDLANHGVTELLSQAIATNMAYAERLGVVLNLHPLTEEVLVHVDANRLLQVMNNLLSNAAKFSPQGQSVEVSAVVLGAAVRISVRDRGPGIAVQFHSKIFGKFCQGDTSDSRSKGGSGLGLAISKAIVEIMKGSIGFTSELGQGTTFFIELPIVKSNVQVPNARESTLAAIDLMASSSQLKPSKQAAG